MYHQRLKLRYKVRTRNSTGQGSEQGTLATHIIGGLWNAYGTHVPPVRPNMTRPRYAPRGYKRNTCCAREKGQRLAALDDEPCFGMKRYALYPQIQYGSARVRALIDFMQVQFGPLPYWSAVCSRSDFPARAKSKPTVARHHAASAQASWMTSSADRLPG